MSIPQWSRGLLVVALCALGEYVVCRLAFALVRPATEVLASLGPAHPQAAVELVTGAAAVVLALGWSWLTIAAMLMVVDVARGAAPGRRLAAPPRWHRAIAGLLGVGTLCLPLAAAAVAPDNDANGGRGRPAATAVDGLPLPDRPWGTGDRAPTSTTEYRVMQGDSLWALVRQHLGRAASDAHVARTWPLWYAANEDAIGPDPHLLLPGTVLKSPPDQPGPGCSAPGSTPAGDDPRPPHEGRP